MVAAQGETGKMKTNKRTGRGALKTEGAQEFDPQMNVKITRKANADASAAKEEKKGCSC